MSERLTRANRAAMLRIRNGGSPYTRSINNPGGSRMVEMLERRGLIDRRGDMQWTLTRKGEEALDA